MNLPELYAAVVAKHPRLAFFKGPYTDEEAGDRALIADHWTESLPIGCGVWACGGKTQQEFWNCGRVKEPTATQAVRGRLAALGAFWLAYEGEIK